MKKNYFSQAMLIVCSLAVTMMTSCKEEEKMTTASTVETGYYVKISEDVLSSTVVEAYYVDATGKICSEYITTT